MISYVVGDPVSQSCLFGLVVGLLVFWYTRRRRYNLPPGPFPLPLIGNMHQISTPMLHEPLYEWSKKYGPVISFYVGSTLYIAVNDIETVKEVLLEKGAKFASRKIGSSPSADVISHGGKNIEFAPYGPTLIFHRKLILKAIRLLMRGTTLDDRRHGSLEDGLSQLAADCNHGAFDPAQHIDFIALNISMGWCFGKKYKYDDPEIRRLLEVRHDFFEFFTNSCLEDIIPCIQYVWKTAPLRKLESLINELFEFLANNYKQKKETFDRGNIRAFCDTLILARVEAEEEGREDLDKLTETHIIMALSDSFFAGLDGGRMTLRFAVLHMCAYPDIQAKVHEELDRVIGRERLPVVKDRAHLPYTEAVLHESMRLASIAPVGIPHMSMCDTTIAGYDIPKNTQVMINHWALHHRSDAWDNVNEFIPERYLDENGKLGPKPENWLPFSAGRRVCLGQSLAKPELHLIFASLMQRFTWSLEEGVTANLTPDGNIGILIPKPHKVVIKERTSIQ